MTQTQQQILTRIANGRPIKAIAKDMNLSQKTVDYHWGKLKSLLGVKNHVEAAHYAIARKLVPLMFSMALLTAHAQGATVNLAWDASPSPGVTNYVLYVSTNSLPQGITNALRLSVGTNLTASATFTNTATVNFAVTAQAGGLESDLSNILIAQVPAAPANMRTVALQYSTVLTGPFTNAMFLSLKIISPSP